MKVVFNNKTEIEISQEIANILRDRIKEGCGQWQIFSEKDSECFLMINLNEVAFITKK